MFDLFAPISPQMKSTRTKRWAEQRMRPQLRRSFGSWESVACVTWWEIVKNKEYYEKPNAINNDHLDPFGDGDHSIGFTHWTLQTWWVSNMLRRIHWVQMQGCVRMGAWVFHIDWFVCPRVIQSPQCKVPAIWIPYELGWYLIFG